MVLFSMLCQLIFADDFVSIKELYMSGYKYHTGGGIICGGLFFIFHAAIGIPGVIIVMAISAIIMILLITEISLSDIYDGIKSLKSDDEEEEIHTDKKTKTNKSNHIKNNAPPEKKKANVRKAGQLRDLKASPAKSDVNKPKDFFALDEDIHEISPEGGSINTGNPGAYVNNGTTGAYVNTGNSGAYVDSGIEQIVMRAEQDELTPEPKAWQPEPKAWQPEAKAWQPEPKEEQLEPKAATNANVVSHELTATENAQAEDILANAINGNLHPETVNDMASAEVTASLDKEKKKTEKQPKKDLGQKSYKTGASYKFPTPSLLTPSPKSNNAGRDAYVKSTAIKLKTTLENFGVNVTITNYSCGPAVTRFEMQPEQGVKVSKILGLADDIKLALAAADIRIEAPIPGKAAIGIEVPNKENTVVSFRELAESDNFKKARSKIAFAVGKDISGQVIVGDIAKMPHLLIAGATGSGKSVCINTLIMSILFKAKPEEVKLIMIDPKMVELACYNGIPHLLIPVVTDPKKASGALNWAVEEMTRRYQAFADCQVRNIQGYNEKVNAALESGEVNEEKLAPMPQIVVIVDELADLMMVAHGEVEDAIVRLSQLARAAGIHLVIATQRPSVDVITGLIKANVPSRIAFAVSSGVDSRTILDMVGAEKLLGKGDMLFYPTGYPKPVRVQGAFISDDDVNKVVDFLKKQNGIGTYDDEISKSISSVGTTAAAGGSSGTGYDDYFIEAGRFILEQEKASIGMLQRKFRIGFNRAARIMDQLEEVGVVGPDEGTKARKIIMSPEQFDEFIDECF
jgi:S-DNA-T family DNA segregation ATPase FtsK/SpoIIIE